MSTRRVVLTRSAALLGAASTSLLLPQIVRAQSNKLRIGLMLPYTGTFAALGINIEAGFNLVCSQVVQLTEERLMNLFLRTALSWMVVDTR